jgi:hypothetical protein
MNPTASSATGVDANGALFDRLWRTSGIQFILLFVVAYLVYGHQPPMGASADTLLDFYQGHRQRVLIAAIFSGMAGLYLLWFGAALRTTLANSGYDSWGAAATASSAALGAMLFILTSVAAALACSTVGSANPLLLPGANDLAWACLVLTSFPRAMLIMAGTFGFWRAGLISNAVFAAGVAIVVLVLLGGTTWMSDGFWAPDGDYARFVSPIMNLVWIAFASRVLLGYSNSGRSGW